MSWQIATILFLIASAAFALLQRSIARQFQTHANVAMAFIYLCIVSPLAIVYAFLNYEINFNLPLLTWPLFAIAGILFALSFTTAYKSNAHIDAAQFVIVTNLNAVFAVAIAALFLGERMNFAQIVGVLTVIVAAAMVSIKRTTSRTLEISSWSLLAMLSALFLAFAQVFEKHFLGQMNLGTYMVTGWSFQTLAMVVLAFKERKTIKDFGKRGLAKLSTLGLLRFLQGITFITALSQIDVGLLASIGSYKAVLIFIGALIFLHERDHLIRKFIGTILATMGLLLLFS